MRGVYERTGVPDVWWIRYADHAGKIRREKAGTKAAAIQLYSIRKTSAWTGKKLPHTIRQKAITFGDLAKDTLVWLAARPQRDPGDKDRVELLAKLFGDAAAESILPADIERKLDAIAAEREWKPATWNRHKAVVSLIYRLALANKKVTNNTARLVQRRPEDEPEERYLLPREEKRLRAVIEPKHPERWAFIVLAFSTGMRAGELKRLRWTEVKGSRVTLPKTKNRTIGHIPLNADARAALKVLRKFDPRAEHVCPRQHYRVWFEIALKAAKIESFRFHDLRHTFASRLAMAGVDMLEIAKLMRHKTLAMVQRYAHLSPEHLAGAVGRISTGTRTGTGNFGRIKRASK
jgi:integrase